MELASPTVDLRCRLAYENNEGAPKRVTGGRNSPEKEPVVSERIGVGRELDTSVVVLRKQGAEVTLPCPYYYSTGGEI